MSYLSHHGVLGQKWGVRRYQNPDGSLTEKGKKRQVRILKERSRFIADGDSYKTFERDENMHKLIKSTKAFKEGSDSVKGQKSYYITKEKVQLANSVLEEIGAINLSLFDKIRSVEPYNMEIMTQQAIDRILNNPK